MGNMSSKNTINDASYQGLKATSGAAHVLSTTAGAFVSEQKLTLSATSQSLTVPTGAVRALIRIQGGTVTDLAYLSLDASAAVTTDFYLRNIFDTTLPAPNITEILIASELTDVRILGTANASTAVIWYFA